VVLADKLCALELCLDLSIIPLSNLFFRHTVIISFGLCLCKTVLLPVVLCGCEIWSLTIMGERRLVFENRTLTRIFGQRRDEVVGGWRKLLNEELHNLYSSPSSIKMMKSGRMSLAGHVARMGRRRIRIDYW
jgi:hypothetical protein